MELLDGNKVIVSCKVTRRAGGIDIYVKSEAFEKWMNDIALYPTLRDLDPNNDKYWNITDKKGWGAYKAYRIEGGRDDLNCLYSWGANKLYILENKVPNLAFLKVKGLSQGVTFKLHGLYGNDEIKKWKVQAKEQIIRIYKNYIAPVCSTVHILEVDEI